MYVSMLPHPFKELFAHILHSKVSHLYLSNTSRVVQHFKIDAVTSRYTAQGKCWKINASIWFCCMKNMKSLVEEQWGAEAPHLLEPQKTHLTCEFVVVPWNCSCMMLSLASRLANVVKQWGSETKFWVFTIFFKNHYPAIWKCFLVLRQNIRCKMDQYYSIKVVLVA